jgi:phosphopantothenoylcysteine decarboxylase/phosphopantothenate--cysteine ligase
VGQGDQACGETGDGRMLEADELLADLTAFFSPSAGRAQRAGDGWPDLRGHRPGARHHQPVQRQDGFCHRARRREAGAEVTLVAGPVSLPTPRGVHRVDVKSARDMLARCCPASTQTARSSWPPRPWPTGGLPRRPTRRSRRTAAGHAHAAFIENPDILATVAHSPRGTSRRGRPGGLYCVGFAAESHDLLAHASAKRVRKGVPLLVGNIGPATFGRTTTRCCWWTPRAPRRSAARLQARARSQIDS